MTDDDGGLFKHNWLVFGTISVALHSPTPLPSLFVDKTCCVLIQQHSLFFSFSALHALEPKKAAASGLYQSGFVSKPVEADVELSSPTSKAQVPVGILRASFRRVAWVLACVEECSGNVRGNIMHLCERIATMCERSVRCSGECSSICLGICRSSSGICLESGFVGVLTAMYDILLAVFGVLHLFMWGECSG